MARLSRLQFLGVAITFHLLYVCSTFDVYFVSPVVGGMKAHRVQTSGPPPARRVVLFVVSHTRVPTESRPGHVALLAGLYEDVSAVTTGWKLNPVGFDSVLNRRRHTWSWGSPDILPMFAEGADPGRVDTYMYSADAEDFSKDATELDRWVFDGVKRFFSSAAEDGELEAALRQDQNIFFLHLLGLDTSGHSYRPYSREYLYNVQVVDQGVREMTALFEAFFADDQTAFIFTADHGMTDIAVLIAYLAGIPFPVNSVGQLPLSYIDADKSGHAEAMLVNTQEILEMYRAKEHLTMARKLWYIPFAGLTDNRDQTISQEEIISRIRAAIDQVIISIVLLALLYRQSSPYQYYAYATFPILFWVDVLAYRESWIRVVRTNSKQFSASNVTTGAVGGLALGLLLEAIVQSFHDRTIYTLVYLLAIFWPVLYGAEFILANWFLCLAWALQCASMSIFTLLPANKTEDTTLMYNGTLGGLLIFAFGVWHLMCETKILNRASSGRETVATDRISKVLLTLQVGLVPLALLVTLSAAESLRSKEGRPRLTQILGWAILVTSFTPLFFYPRTGTHRLRHGTLFTWVQLESRVFQFHQLPPISSSSKESNPPFQVRSLYLSDARIALFFLYLSHSAFFSTGNIASISSFSLDAVLRLIPVFEPFSQSALLILKILAPFVLVSVNLGILTRSLRLRPGALFVLVVAASDYLTLRFFWRVRDEGSWLEIGESITVFVLASLLCGFVAGLEMIGVGVVGGLPGGGVDGVDGVVSAGEEIEKRKVL
ncbi:GPI ethanolamine phosphate transferase 1 [Aspergillus alliaceus]|uniref:GPI ethanolamine phosphate transferase 1 n=1 Tax=Petromyces alliaceus TaxID=209559 RepID=UPI0012A50ACE|nr:Phosphatidylinositolglycan class N-domain-containing protein [Aspergillus alliaceus]KAB8228299.1 Phosphatidylinositolglycan class N-domain-containing protein [Aspergillus alliaceus]